MIPRREIRTLIVDDSDKFATGVKNWMESRGDLEWIGTVGSGLEAAAAVERLAPDLVLLDVVLPGLDGFRVVTQLKRMPVSPLAVIMTFQAGETARQAAFDAGADGFIAKDEFAEGLDLLLPELIEKLKSGKEPGRARLRRPVTPDQP